MSHWQRVHKSEDYKKLPFEYDTPITWYEMFKMIFFWVSLIAPLRILLSVLFVLTGYVCTLFATVGMSKKAVYERPMAPWRRRMLSPIPYLSRAVLFVCGFYHIEVDGQFDPAACLVTPNHVSLFDMLLLYWLALPSALSKAEAFDIPVVSQIFRALQVIPVYRLDGKNKQEALLYISKFAESRTKNAPEYEKFPPVLIFPQGTTTQECQMTTFQRGAFVPGLPVQPMGLHYPYKHFNPAFVVNRKSEWFFSRHVCQFVMHAKVTILPVYRPSEEEKKDAILFASNVRDKIARAIGAETVDYGYEDAVLYRCAVNMEEKRYKQRACSAVPSPLTKVAKRISFQRLKTLFQRDTPTVGNAMAESKSKFTVTNAKQAMMRFVDLDLDGDGVIDLKEFCRVTRFDPENDHSKRVFNLLDLDSSGTIDLRELLFAVVMSSRESRAFDKVRLAFEIMDENGDGLISIHEIRRMLQVIREYSKGMFDDANAELDQLISKIPSDADGKMSLDQFQAVVKYDSMILFAAIASMDIHIPEKDRIFSRPNEHPHEQ